MPLFPLSVILFPGTTHPLHIFEPRYRRMLADCLIGDRRFGITPPGREEETPEAGAVGCIAEVRVNQELPDGRSNIVVLGGQRFVLDRVLPDPAPYYIGAVSPFDDDEGTMPSEERIAGLREVFQHYDELVRHINDIEPGSAELPPDALGLSFHAAAGIECDLSVKQRLLAQRSTAARVEALITIIPALADGLEKALEVHRRAPSNGKGNAAQAAGA